MEQKEYNNSKNEVNISQHIWIRQPKYEGN